MTAATPVRARPLRCRSAVGGLALAGLVVALVSADALPDWPRGYALYRGFGTLDAEISGTGVALPAKASACVNCHDATPSGAPRRIGPLDRAALTTATPRRGGPPSAYSGETFCAVLRDGVDPAFVMVDRTMPRFRLSDEDCRALWTYVSVR